MPKLLILAYYFPPDPRVGGFRAAGFHRYLPEFGWETHVVTAIASDEDDPRITRVPAPPAGGGLVKDPSGPWISVLKQRLGAIIEAQKPDAVLITGGPFLYFGLGRWIKRCFGLPYLLDFRDPFVNPRFGRRPLKNAIARALETHWAAKASGALVVTEAARPLVHAPSHVPVHVIENGYDDEALQPVVAKEPVHASPLTLVHAGTFTHDRNPIPLLRAMKRVDPAARLVHVGEPFEHAAITTESLPYDPVGPMDYGRALEAVRDAHVAVVVGTGVAFEPTTKVYDYIGLGKPVLAVGTPSGGGVHGILERYGAYAMCDNREDAIASAFRALIEGAPEPPADRNAFGRRFQTGRLAAILDGLVGRNPDRAQERVGAGESW